MSVVTIPVTLSVAAACALINLWLALRLTGRRVRGKVLLGDGGDAGLQAGMRAHSNFVEYAPFVLILIAAIEVSGGSRFWLQVAGVAFVIARLAHPIGMARGGTNVFRAGGILINWAVLALLAGWAATLAYQGAPLSGTIQTEAVPAQA